MSDHGFEPIALVDMDGTLCDYTAALQRDLDGLRSPDDPPTSAQHGPEEPAWLKARKRLIKRQPGWWRALEPIPQSFAVLAIMRRLSFDLHILTKGPWGNPEAWAEKVSWCREHVPDASLHLSEDKGLVYGKVLMDDYPVYIRRWLQWRPRGLVIMPAWPWNEGAFADHPNVVRYDGSNLDEVEARLQAARDR